MFNDRVTKMPSMLSEHFQGPCKHFFTLFLNSFIPRLPLFIATFALINRLCINCITVKDSVTNLFHNLCKTRGLKFITFYATVGVEKLSTL